MEKTAIVLAKCPVCFNESEHTYTYNGVELSGVTSMLSRTLFKDKYKNVPDFVLKNAAERGSDIHNEISMYLAAGIMPDTVEGKNFAKIILPCMKPIATEYLVSDLAHFASSIDIVGEGSDADSVILYDVKTTRQGLDTQYTAWQLSVYAYLFEKQNPGLIVESINGLWLAKLQANKVPLDRIPNEVIEQLLESDVAGKPFVNPLVRSSDDIESVRKYLEFETQYIALSDQLKRLDELKKTALDEVMGTMTQMGVTTLKTDRIEFTVVGETTKTTIDSKRLKEEAPELYEKYSKTSKIKPYLKSKIIA